MNHKILHTLEFGQIRSQLKQLAVTGKARELAENLLPSTDLDEIQTKLKETELMVNLLAEKGKLPLTAFEDLAKSIKLLKIKAVLAKADLGNILLAVNLGQDVGNFLAEVDGFEQLVRQLEFPENLQKLLAKSVDYDGEILDTASQKLFESRMGLQKIDEQIQDKLNGYLKGSFAQYLSENLVTIRDDRYVLPVKQSYRKKFGGVVHDQSASGQTLFIEPSGILDLSNQKQSLMAKIKQEENRIIKHLSEELQVAIPELTLINQNLVDLDFWQAKALLAKQMKASRPSVNADHQLLLKNARHPLLDPAKVVANTISLGIDFDMLLITGPNTGGKTLTLKTTGLLQLMLQAGLFIPVDSGSKATVFSEIFADIGDEQSIEQNLSTFSSHMTEIIKILKVADEHSLILLDELGAGTDPEEGARLGIAILDELRRQKCQIMVTTHYPELKLYGYNRERTSNASMEFDLHRLAPTYHLQIGIPGQSNAFAIARRLGMSEQVVVAAEKLMDKDSSDLNNMIIALNEQTQKATLKKTQLENAYNSAKSLERELQMAVDWYKQRVEKQLDFANERANQIVAKRRKEADKIIEKLQSNTSDQLNQVIEAKGQFTKLTKEQQNLANNKVLRREKTRHQVKVGDQVKVVSYNQMGTITKKLSEHEYEVQMGIVKAKINDRDLDKLDKVVEKKKPVRSGSGGIRNSVRSKLDLRGQRYDEAMHNLDQYMDSVLLSGLDTCVIVHGIGTGAIRTGVWNYLKCNRHIKSYQYAPANQGGNGATIVVLK